jgi:hypothetical protein
MTGKQKSVQDLSHLTCTNLMIRLKMLLKNTSPGTPVECIIRRDQRDMIAVPFSRTGYEVKVWRVEGGNYQIQLIKKESARDPA